MRFFDWISTTSLSQSTLPSSSSADSSGSFPSSSPSLSRFTSSPQSAHVSSLLSPLFYSRRYILKFFLHKNIKIARKRAWDLVSYPLSHSFFSFLESRELNRFVRVFLSQTVESRGKPASFWGRYVEEYEVPPVEKARKASKRARVQRVVFGKLGRFFVNKCECFVPSARLWSPSLLFLPSRRS